MNTQAVTTKLRMRYPGKTIIKNNEKDPTEILCEVEPTSKHPDHSLAVSVIDKSLPHVHEKSTEIYKVVRGKLELNVDGKIIKLIEGEKHTISPGQTHWAEGNETWVECSSKPGWTPEDHVLVECVRGLSLQGPVHQR